MKPDTIVPTEYVEKRILLIRGERIILDYHLASIYEVSTKALIQAIKRNANRFPRDFMFQLTKKEAMELQSQMNVQELWGGRRYLPYAFDRTPFIGPAVTLRVQGSV